VDADGCVDRNRACEGIVRDADERSRVLGEAEFRSVAIVDGGEGGFEKKIERAHSGCGATRGRSNAECKGTTESNQDAAKNSLTPFRTRCKTLVKYS
jgi:hypothetical protein